MPKSPLPIEIDSDDDYKLKEIFYGKYMYGTLTYYVKYKGYLVE